MLNKKPQPQIAVYLGETRRRPVYAVAFVPDPNQPNGRLRWGLPEEVVLDKEDTTSPGRLMQMLLDYEHREVPADYEPEPLSDEQEKTLSRGNRIAVELEPFGRILLYPSRHHPGGGGYGTPREGVRGSQRLTDFELVKLARSL